jgi:signal transduction histidine kinase
VQYKMPRIRLRTKLLLSLLALSLGLTCGSLLVVHQVLQREVEREIVSNLHSSVLTFQNAQHQREQSLSRSAELLANLPTVRALMTTRDEATIQDASLGLWRLAGSDLFVLTDRFGRVMALRATTAGLSAESAQQEVNESLSNIESTHWWFTGGHLYEVFIQPVYFGNPVDNHLLGLLAVGHEIDSRVAAELARICDSQTAFVLGDSLIVSTLPATQAKDLVSQTRAALSPTSAGPASIFLTGEKFLLTSLPLGRAGSAPVRLVVLKSYDQASSFLHRLNHLLLGLGMIAVLVGSVVVVLISHTFTHPLKNLVLGVRSLEKGDFAYPLKTWGDDEVAEVTGAFDRMRNTLRLAQQQLLETEQLATIGRMAGSISHDLRHALTAVVANAEFLCETRLNISQRDELYQEIRVAVDQMTDLIDSLLEFSKTKESLRPVHTSLEESVRRAIYLVRANRDYQRVTIDVSSEGSTEGCFDIKKLERVFYNLLRNACEALTSEYGIIQVSIRPEHGNRLCVRVCDNGVGIPDAIRDRLFKPFVSYGKENGTGLGLAVVYKIIQDHGGEVTVETTSSSGTTFKIILPIDFTSGVAVTEKQINGSVVPHDQQSA